VIEGSPFSTLAADGVYLILRNRSGAFLGISNTSLTPPDESLVFMATDTVYFIEVVGVLTGDYSLLASNLTSFDDSFLPIPALAGLTYTARLDFTGDQETYLAQLGAGRRYFGAVWSNDIADLFLDIEDPFGASAGVSVAGGGSAYFFTPGTTGEYLISVSSDSFRDTGTFRFFAQETFTVLPLWVGTPTDDAHAASAGVEFWGWDGNDTATGSAVADAMIGGEGNDSLVGGGGTDTLVGDAGSDTIAGDAGADSLVGGLGNDLYIADTADTIVETAPGGTDTLRSSQSITLPDWVEVLELSGPPNLTGTGNALANTLVGHPFNARLNGGGGNDTLLGSFGRDTLAGDAGADSLVGGNGDDYYVIDALDRVVEAQDGGNDSVQAAGNHILAAGVEVLVQTGSLNVAGTGNTLGNALLGNSGNNALNGAAGNDTIFASEGQDTLTGGVGADRLVGGPGDDLYVADALDRIFEFAGGGADTVHSAGNHVMAAEIEALLLIGALDVGGNGNAGANTITGNGGRNRLAGNGGNDTLLGGLGADTLTGGPGADSLVGGGDGDLYVADALDRILETADGGADTVQAAGNIVIAANVEDLVQTGMLNAAGTGNALANRMLGNAGDNLLSGAQANDTLDGGAGADTLLGGLGADSLAGGADADMFRYDLAAHGLDAIADFSAADDQVMVDASGFGGGLSAGIDLAATGRFVAHGTSAANSATGIGQFVFNTTNGQLWWDADGAGGAAAVRIATLQGVGAGGFTADDITVVA
jgi:Ca2+-binding RTX toxin-like protein